MRSYIRGDGMTEKLNKKGFFIIVAIFAIFIGLIPIKRKSFVFNIANSDESAKPLFSSSFIQYWYCEDFDQVRWKQELEMLKELGINELILQTVAYTDTKYAVYPTKIEGYKSNDVDMLENVLSMADLLSMKVRVGLGFNNDWWIKRASDLNWLNNEAVKNKDIFNEIVERYGNHPSLSGWYIPHEFSQITAITIKEQRNLNSFFKEIASEIKAKSPGKDIMISPYYSSKYSWTPLLPVWSLMVRNILKGTGIDILALQDAVGAQYNTTEQLASVFSYTKRATDAVGVKLYSVTETFTAYPGGFAAAPQNSISKQLSVVRNYVQGFVAFSISHYQNLQSSSAGDYYDYYISNR
jgi:hypothetical protein